MKRTDIYVLIAVLCLGATLWTYYNTDRYYVYNDKDSSFIKAFDKNTGIYYMSDADSTIQMDIPNAKISNIK